MWLFDVFSGMPQPGPEDPPEALAHTGTLTTSPQVVEQNLRSAELPIERVIIIPGLYEDTLKNYGPFDIAFLHIDCDWYDSVRLCLETFFDQVVPGGAIVLDDYGHWSGCRKAVDEFIAVRELNVQLRAIDYTSHYFFKPE